jgi:hypothetical protein
MRITGMSMLGSLKVLANRSKGIVKDMLESPKWPRRPQQLAFEIWRSFKK